jgi:drug/metabolite transporter (DMT)-like permease
MSPILRAIVAILISVMCFSVLNAMSKTLSQSYPVIEVIWARYFFAFILMLGLFLPRSGMNLFRLRNVGSQVVRGLLLFFSSFLYFHGIVYMPLAAAAAISLTSPLIVTALSARFLHEPSCGPARPISIGMRC